MASNKGKKADLEGGGGRSIVVRTYESFESFEDMPLLALEPTAVPQAQDRQKLMMLSMALLFLLSLGGSLFATPQLAIYEEIICRQFYPQAVMGLKTGMAANDPACKSADVQGAIAELKGWSATLDTIPAMLCSIPFGLLSDKWGRRPVLALATFGLLLSCGWICLVFLFADVVPLHAVLFSSVFQVMGGGGCVAGAMLFTGLSDVVPLAERSSVFFRLTSLAYVADLIASPLAGLLMLNNSAWVTLSVAMALITMSSIVACMVPETLQVRKKPNSMVYQVTSPVATHAVGHGQEIEDAFESGPASPKTCSVWAETWHEINDSMREFRLFIVGNQRIGILLLSMTLMIMGGYSSELLLQYATKRYDWSWSTGSFMLTIKSVGTLVLLLAVLPAASWACTSRLGMAAPVRDLWLARWSTTALVMGALATAFAAKSGTFVLGLLMSALGSGLYSLVRSLSTALVEEHHIGMLNTAVALLENAGLMLAAPLLSEALKAGLARGGNWDGLAFLCAALLYAGATAIVWTFSLPPDLNLDV